MKLDNNQQPFFALLRAGLWEQDVHILQFGIIDYSAIYKIAEEQSVVGLVAAGLEHVVDTKVPKEEALQFAGASLQLEQRNIAMNIFLNTLINKLRENDIYALVVKGQGIAQCYERPLWRASGDVDLLLGKENYERAKAFLIPMASNVEIENVANYHLAMSISQWEVELHGSIKPDLGKRIDKCVDEVQEDTISNNHVRIWNIGDTEVSLPAPDNDIIFIFSHILQHFYRGGIGLRQVCDWCRLLWTYRDEMDKGLLKRRLLNMGIMREWKVFASLAVSWLGMPVGAIPFYSSDKGWKNKAKEVMSFIIEDGNFGHNRDISYYGEHSRIITKVMSLWRHSRDSFRLFLLFPKHSVISWWRMLVHGMKWL